MHSHLTVLAQNKMIKLVRLEITLAALCLSVITAGRNFPVSPQCLSCLCEAISSCDTRVIGCSGAVCGPFRITWAYWSDAGKPTVNDESPEEPTAFKNCALDVHCSIRAVQAHMALFRQDCNGDGKIDCDDFAAIHKLGGYGCKKDSLRGIFWEKYQQCKLIVGAS